jgi:chemotaxis methyl-accepting protein methylase
MFSDTSFPSGGDGSETPPAPINPVDKKHFQDAIRRLNILFDIYARTSPVPLPAPGLIITPDIRTQCERYLPIADVTAVFNRLYRVALSHPPILSSTPFHAAMSWADAFSSLPSQFQFSANPARILEVLLDDADLLNRFLFASFLPERFYGGVRRYTGQQEYIRQWLATRKGETLNCLDAACGTGETTYGLALLLAEGGFSPSGIRIEGWTLEPLEVWAAAQRCFPHDRRRKAMLQESTSELYRQGYCRNISFHCADLTEQSINLPRQGDESGNIRLFDLILCNGILGGPIMHEEGPLVRTVENLAQLLVPGGILLAADNFHGGWKQKFPHGALQELLQRQGLQLLEVCEGMGAVKL